MVTKFLFLGNEKTINAAAKNDFEEKSIHEETNINEVCRSFQLFEEDPNLIRSKSKFPSYQPSNTSTQHIRLYAFSKKGKSPFVEYNGDYIRKVLLCIYVAKKEPSISK